MEEKVKVPDLNSLSRIFLDIIKTISKSGNVLNNATLSQFLSKNPRIRYMLQQAHKAEKGQLEPVATPKVDVEPRDDHDRLERDRKTIVELDAQLNLEKDANKRAVLTLISLTKVESNKQYFDKIDEYKQLVMDEVDVAERIKALDSLKKLLHGEEQVVNEPPVQPPVILEKSEKTVKKSALGRLFGSPADISLKMLQRTILSGLEDLKDILGETYYPPIQNIEDRITESDDINYLLSLRKQIIGIIREFVSEVNEERESVTGFMQNIGTRLQEMEDDINSAFSSTNKHIEEDKNFNTKLNAHIKDIGDSVERSTNFNELKVFIVGEMSRIADTLEEKSREYNRRLEAANAEREKMRGHFKTMIGNVIEQNKALVEQNKKDPLTCILNRATFDEILSVEFERYKRYSEKFTIIMFDIDHFKNINDTYGHVAGDKVLKGLSAHISDMLRSSDIFARYGGEEFIILLPNTVSDNGIAVAEKLRALIEEAEFLYEGSKVPITASVGVTEVMEHDDDMLSIIKRADACMYKAKDSGRNAVFSDVDNG